MTSATSGHHLALMVIPTWRGLLLLPKNYVIFNMDLLSRVPDLRFYGRLDLCGLHTHTSDMMPNPRSGGNQ